MGALYRLTSPSGRQYIGVTTWSAEARFAEHCKKARNGHGYALHAAIRKYGPESFKVETLAVADDPAYLHEVELRAIRLMGTLHPGGYNLTQGGEGILGLAQEARARRSMALKGRSVSIATRAKISEAAKAQMQRPGMRELLSARAVGRSRSAELNDRMSTFFQATHRTPEMRARISEATKAAHSRPDVRARVSANAKAKWASEGARAAHAEKIKQKWADPEWRAATLRSRAAAQARRSLEPQGE